MKRKIIRINEELCNGCGLCIPNCPEGAMRVIDGKVRIISDLFCDGLGACMGYCPLGALSLEEREAEPYDEKKVMANVIKQGDNVIKAHIEHLLEHGETDYANEARDFLLSAGYDMEKLENLAAPHKSFYARCTGSKATGLAGGASTEEGTPSALSNWPVQLHLISPDAPCFQKRDVLFAADCVPYALGGFHKNYLSGRSLIVACPKLDNNQEIYVEKIIALIDEAEIASLCVMIMEVPCCGGLVYLVNKALERSNRKMLFTVIEVGIRGEVKSEEKIAG